MGKIYKNRDYISVIRELTIPYVGSIIFRGSGCAHDAQFATEFENRGTPIFLSHEHGKECSLAIPAKGREAYFNISLGGKQNEKDHCAADGLPDDR